MHQSPALHKALDGLNWPTIHVPRLIFTMCHLGIHLKWLLRSSARVSNHCSKTPTMNDVTLRKVDMARPS